MDSPSRKVIYPNGYKAGPNVYRSTPRGGVCIFVILPVPEKLSLLPLRLLGIPPTPAHPERTRWFRDTFWESQTEPLHSRGEVQVDGFVVSRGGMMWKGTESGFRSTV